jgi:hypothetical protein
MKNCSVDSGETSNKPRAYDWVNKLVLACILVPTGFWAVEKAQPYFLPRKLLTGVYHVGTKAAMTLREALHAGLQTELRDDLNRINSAVEELEDSIAQIEAFDPKMAASHRKVLEMLNEEQQSLLAMKVDEVRDLGRQVVADLDRRIRDEQLRTNQQVLSYTQRKTRIHLDEALVDAAKAQRPQATRTLNKWLDAIDENDRSAALDLMTQEAAQELTPRRMARLKDRLGKVESMQVTRHSDGRLGFTIGEGSSADRVFVGLKIDGDLVAIDAVEF